MPRSSLGLPAGPPPVVRVALLAVFVSWRVGAFRRRLRAQKQARKSGSSGASASSSKRQAVRVDALFFSRLRQLLPVLIPGVQSKEALVLAAHTAALAARTLISIWIARLDGAVVSALVRRDGRRFVRLLVMMVVSGFPATLATSMIRYLESTVALRFRTRLTRHAHELYMSQDTYYRVGNLDSRVPNVDQRLTEDIREFTDMLAHLHSNVSKPLFDIFLVVGELKQRLGRRPLGGGGIVAALTLDALQSSMPAFGRYVATRSVLEGRLRSAHARVIEHAEEIAFYRGASPEQKSLDENYASLATHLSSYHAAQVPYRTFEGLLIRYVWTAFGYLMSAYPIFAYGPAQIAAEDVATNTAAFVTNKRLLVNSSDATERLFATSSEIAELAGHLARVSEMLEVFRDVGKGEYAGAAMQDLATRQGELSIIEGAGISFEDVPIVSPSGDVIVKKLSFEQPPGHNLLITGPNGCGKSSLFRVLCGLWPVAGGRVQRPAENEIFYVPQRPYLFPGTLRDQITYPHTMAEKQQSESKLRDLLDIVSLRYILEREGGWDVERDWGDMLSGGEQQRVALARLFYHAPRFAILDESTSAVSIDVEAAIYGHATGAGITLLSVSHRPSLWSFHSHMLQFDGLGGWKFEELNTASRGALCEEREDLRRKMEDFPKMQARLKELDALVGEN